MKDKSMNSRKKLSFKKTTIATLDSEAMDDVRGGTDFSGVTIGIECDTRSTNCHSWFYPCEKVTHDCPQTM